MNMQILHAILLSVVTVVIPYLLFVKKIRNNWQDKIQKSAGWSLVTALYFLVVPLAIDAIFLYQAYLQLLVRAAYIAFLAAIFLKSKHRFRHLALFFLIWLPLELTLFSRLAIVFSAKSRVDTSTFHAVAILIYFYLLREPIATEVFRLKIKTSHFKKIGILMLSLAAIIIPIGLLVNFIEFNPRSVDGYTDIIALPVKIFGYFLFVAIPEELLFRVQLFHSLLQMKALQKLLISSFLFACAHLLNETIHHIPPNWWYFLFSGIAGLAYGWLYLKSNSLLAAALLHASVDGVWIHFFKV